MLDDFQPTMNGIRVSVAALISKLTINREFHRQAFDEAVVGYRHKAQEQLQRNLDLIAKNSGAFDIRVGLTVPKEHTKDYDRALKMLEFSLDEEIILSQEEFAQYIMDDWGWQQEFTATNVMYSGR